MIGAHNQVMGCINSNVNVVVIVNEQHRDYCSGLYNLDNFRCIYINVDL